MLLIKSKRRSIHTGIKILIKQNAIPAYLLEQIHPSQLWKYRNEPDHKYYGCELFDYAIKSEQLLNQYNKYSFDRRVINGFIRLSITVRNAFSAAKLFNKTLLNNKEKIVDVIERLNKKVPLKMVAKIIGVSYETILSWIIQERTKCAESLINVCKKHKPSQLTSLEVCSIKSLLLNQEYKYWPVRSLYYFALHRNKLNMCLSTFYKYARLLNIKRLKPLCKKVYTISVRASKPNEYWHADVMKFKTGDNTFNYIYLVTDNFSKKILSLVAAGKLSAAIRKESFRIAANHALAVGNRCEDVNLIVDGGSENVNKTIDDFIDNFNSIKLNRLIALKQVPFSNSIAEAVNKIIRNSYLNHFSIANLSDLQLKLSFAVDDYNNKRPHGALIGLTPEQAYRNVTVNTDLFSERIKNTRIERRIINHKAICGNCKVY